MRVVLALLIAAVAAVDVRANPSVEFTAPNGRHGRVENVGGGVWRLRLADADGTFSDRGAVQGLAAERGIPAVRPLVLDWQDDPNTYSISDEFMLGDAVLVAPLMGRGNSRRAYLPKGLWLEVASGKMLAVDSGGMWKDVGADVFPPPLFLNADASDFAALLKVLGGKQ